MKKIYFGLIAILALFLCIGCSNGNAVSKIEETKTETAENIPGEEIIYENEEALYHQLSENLDLSIDSKENGIIYYNAKISEDFNWDMASHSKHGHMIEWTIENCRRLFKEETDFSNGENIEKFEVNGFLENGNKAFYFDGSDIVKIYISGMERDQYTLLKTGE